jgi:3-oxoacyl-[acyl-carrier-protein] synthase II
MYRRRVVVTGIGVVSSIGHSADEFWASNRAARSGVGPITLIEAADLPVRIAGEVRGFDPGRRLDPKDARKMDRVSQFAAYASMEAFADAGLQRGSIDPEKTGVVLGTGMGGVNAMQEGFEKLIEKGPSRVPPMTVIKVLPNIAAANVALAIDARGPSQCVTTACAAGTDAIGNALNWIRSGEADVMIAGGAEACITRMAIASFAMIQALSTRNDEPERASRPFDAGRDGFVMAEGAGMLILEDYEHAKRRGARIYCELAGYGASCDAHHLTAPHPDGDGAARAMRRALVDAFMRPEDIDYINAHGTATPLNDPTETLAIKKAFGGEARRIPVSSTKSMTGHCIGAAGGIEAVACVLALRDQWIPPTINLEQADPACDLDYVPNKGREARVRACMSDSMGFGGQNGAIVLRELER